MASDISKERHSVVGVLVAQVVLVVCGVVLGWFAHIFWGVKSIVRERVAPKVPFVAVGEVKSVKLNPCEEFVGHVEPVQEVDILPQVEGYLKEVKFNEGDSVKEGDLLFTIDDERYRAADAVARAEIASAKGKVGEMRAAVDRAERYLRRMRSADARGITQTELDSAETGLAADKASLVSAEAAVAQAEANLALATFNLKHTRIYAPISGRIGKCLRHAGDFVSSSKNPLARIVQTDPVRVTFPLTDRAALAWQRAATARGTTTPETRRLRLRLADGTVYPNVGKWEFEDNEMNSETATLSIRVLFSNAEHLLLPNAYVSVLADQHDPAPVLTVPAAAVSLQGKVPGLWQVTTTNTVTFRPVKLGARVDDLVAINEGIEAGAKIVTQGVHKLGEGMNIKVVPASVFK